MHSIEAIEIEAMTWTELDARGIFVGTKYADITEPMKTFLTEHIRNCIKSSKTRTGRLADVDFLGTVMVEISVMGIAAFLSNADNIGRRFGRVMEKSAEAVQHLAIVLFRDLDTDLQYLALLKMSPEPFIMRYYNETTHQYDTGTGYSLPDPSRTLARFAILRPFEEDTRYDMLYSNKTLSKDEDPETSNTWMEFIECVDVPTPREQTQLVVTETGKFCQQHQEDLTDEQRTTLQNAVLSVAQSDEMDVEAVATAVIPDEKVREEYIERLMDKGLVETSFEPDQDWARNKARKTTYLCDSGVTVSGPSDAIDDVIQILPKTADRKTRVVMETRKFQVK